MPVRMTTIGSTIAYQRRFLGFSQEDIAEKVGVTRSTISRIENGKTDSISLFIAIAHVLDLHACELLALAERVPQHAINDTPSAVRIEYGSTVLICTEVRNAE